MAPVAFVITQTGQVDTEQFRLVLLGKLRPAREALAKDGKPHYPHAMTISPTDQAAARTATGVAFGLSAYLCWGFFPLYFKQLAHVSPLEVLAHRSVWALATLAVLLAGSGGWGLVRAALHDRRQLLILSVTTVLIATNWLVFLFAVTTNQVLQSSLGYFINPLVSVLLGYLFT